MEKRIVYFEKPGKENTGACLDVVKTALNEETYRHVVVATTTGANGLLFSDTFKKSGLNIVIVTHSAGIKGPNTFEMPGETGEKIRANGARIYNRHDTYPLSGNVIECQIRRHVSGHDNRPGIKTVRRRGESLL